MTVTRADLDKHLDVIAKAFHSLPSEAKALMEHLNFTVTENGVTFSIYSTLQVILEDKGEAVTVTVGK